MLFGLLLLLEQKRSHSLLGLECLALRIVSGSSQLRFPLNCLELTEIQISLSLGLPFLLHLTLAMVQLLRSGVQVRESCTHLGVVSLACEFRQ